MLSWSWRISELVGREFDWFAIDCAGHFGMFSTAGFGPVPQAVSRHLGEHDAISDSIPSPSFGSADVWNDFAAVGLYVYDWDGKRYTRVAVPAGGLPPALRAKLGELFAVPSMTCSFDDDTEIVAVDVEGT